MPTPTKGARLGGSPAHERLMLANLATACSSTVGSPPPRPRQAAPPLAKQLITFAKRGDLHARRQVLAVVRDKGVVTSSSPTSGPRFAEPPGGYTRIMKVGPRKGDNAPMAVIELVEPLAEAGRGRGRAAPPSGAADNAEDETAPLHGRCSAAPADAGRDRRAGRR